MVLCDAETEGIDLELRGCHHGMCWDVLKRTGGVGSFVMQEEVVRVADVLFEKE